MWNQKEVIDLSNLKVSKGTYSQHCEESIIEFLLSKCEHKDQICVEFGAGDGMSLSNTKKLEDIHNFRRFLFDVESRNPKVTKVNITRDNIVNVFEMNSVPKDIELLSIDIDGNDIYVTEELLKSNYNPLLIINEFNAAFQPHESKSISYNPNHIWKNDAYYGASFAAFKKMYSNYGYSICYIENCNLFAIPSYINVINHKTNYNVSTYNNDLKSLLKFVEY